MTPAPATPLLGRTRLLLLLSFPAGWLVTWLASFFPNFVEQAYSRGVGRFYFQGLSLATGWFSLPLGQLLTGLAIAAALGFGVFAIVRMARASSGRGRRLARDAINALCGASAVMTIVLIPYGLNFSRLPFQVIAGLEVHPGSTAELRAVTIALIDRANALRARMAEDAGGVMRLSRGRDDVFTSAPTAYDNLALTYPVLGGRYGRPKAMLIPGFMARFYLVGIYCPVTGEANVCTISVDPLLPVLACHEMAHQRGFAREDEANYLAYLACLHHPNPEFQYSGLLMALENLFSSLHRTDPAGHRELLQAVSMGVRRDLNAEEEAYSRYAGPMAQVSLAVNDTFLKSNRQVGGVVSYGRMVDLLIAESRRKP